MARLRRTALLLLLGVVAGMLATASPARAGSIPWCGSGEPAADLPDAVNAYEWHIVYAVASDGVDRFASYAPRIAGDVATMSNWWLAQDSTRRPRFDLVAAPGCPSEPYGRVDISFMRLPKPANDYTFEGIVSDVGATFGSSNKGYLVYYDGTLHAGEEYGVCGTGRTDDRSFAYVVVFLGTCGQSFDDATRVTVATHEMLHGMGAVDSRAPHACDDGHVCDSPNDLMKAVLEDGDSLARLSLDVGRDDYYGHSGSWDDVQDSSLLYRLDQSLDPAPDITGLTATNVGASVRVKWGTSSNQAGVTYNIYDENDVYQREETGPASIATGTVGQTLVWIVRAANPGGFLSPPATLRFKVGYGIVDASGAMLHDTVPPGTVIGLKVRHVGTKEVVSWIPVTDPISLGGYRVTGQGLKTISVTTATIQLPFATVRGKTLSIAAVDEAGNVGSPVAIRVPR
jgi:hypothetical protein